MRKTEFFYEIDFSLGQEQKYRVWIEAVILSEGLLPGAISYIFCDDEYLLGLHQKYLNNDGLTDIVTFDYTEGDILAGDIFISIPRVKENATNFGCSFEDELARVMSHGVLHLAGYKDKSPEDKEIMRKKENEKMEMFHVEHL